MTIPKIYNQQSEEKKPTSKDKSSNKGKRTKKVVDISDSSDYEVSKKTRSSKTKTSTSTIIPPTSPEPAATSPEPAATRPLSKYTALKGIMSLRDCMGHTLHPM